LLITNKGVAVNFTYLPGNELKQNKRSSD